MTKSPSKPTSFEDESDNRFPRARVLIVGEDTSLAAAFFETDASGGQQRIVLPSSVNLADDREIFEAIRMRRPDFVVNCMVESGVDRAELDPTECRQINHDLPVSLAIACREFDATLIQLSTDYIFDGQKDIAYFEDDAPNPLNLYGQTRLEAERDIESLLDRHIILRVSHLFAPGPNSFVTNILDRARIESKLPMIEDERGCPTSIFDIGRVVSAVIDQLNAGAGAYGASFFMLTGFHGFHVMLGTLMLIVILLRSMKGHFDADHHFGFEGVAWYWHFVDVVWLGLFVFVYWL
ncbi:MAG: NAD-dependent epimerase/dehydratase family protein [Gammaproteobacteria bacterium]|nr:NAD-dependent epimerase/dehydratase family protein [Gammaproteobacteria bacterium]